MSPAVVLSAETQASPKNVLIISGYLSRDDGRYLDALESSLRARVPERVNLYVNYLEPSRFNDKAYRESQAETFRSEYGRSKPDLLIVLSDPAFPFVLQYHDKMFPGTPILVTGIGLERLGEKRYPGVTAVTGHVGLRETIDLALRLNPDADTVAVLADDTDDFRRAVAHSELLRHRDKVKEAMAGRIYLSKSIKR